MQASSLSAVAVPARKRKDPATFIIALSVIIVTLTFLAVVTTQTGSLNF